MLPEGVLFGFRARRLAAGLPASQGLVAVLPGWLSLSPAGLCVWLPACLPACLPRQLAARFQMFVTT